VCVCVGVCVGWVHSIMKDFSSSTPSLHLWYAYTYLVGFVAPCIVYIKSRAWFVDINATRRCVCVRVYVCMCVPERA
jgi:hypothetical protein